MTAAGHAGGPGGITYSRRGLHGQIVRAIGRQIVGGELKPGDVVEIEGVEAEFGVSRTVVREAIKVLTAKGLLDARPRHGTFVLPRAAWNLLDADVMSWRDTGEPDPAFLGDLDEVRRIFEPMGARLAAQRRTKEDIEVLASALADMSTTQESGNDPTRHAAADLRFHRAILAATHNELLERLEVVLEPALHARDLLAFSAHDQSRRYLDEHSAVLQAIKAGDGDRAEAAMWSLLRQAAQDTERIVRKRNRRVVKGKRRT